MGASGFGVNQYRGVWVGDEWSGVMLRVLLIEQRLSLKLAITSREGYT